MESGGTHGTSHSVVSRVAHLFGYHFQATRWILTLLGAKVGQRVYFPGGAFYCVDFDLLEIGDDVVFGSRSCIICQGTLGARRVRIETGSMVADRCVILPGCTVGEQALLGSGSTGPADTRMKPKSVWIGSRRGSPVEAPSLARSNGEVVRRPFARAYYGRQAKYCVWPSSVHVFHGLLWLWLGYIFNKAPLILSAHYTTWWLGPEGSETSLFLLLLQGNMLSTATVAFLMVQLTKCLGKLVIGRRVPGQFAWDEVSYCQRWLLSRKHVEFMSYHQSVTRGSPLMNWYLRQGGAKIGAGACMYPTGADPYMTEKGLVTVGSLACVDDAALNSHINSYGTLELRPLQIGERAVLRCGSKLGAGARLEDGAILLEHTFVLPGDTVPAGEVWQGWPGSAVG